MAPKKPKCIHGWFTSAKQQFRKLSPILPASTAAHSGCGRGTLQTCPSLTEVFPLSVFFLESCYQKSSSLCICSLTGAGGELLEWRRAADSGPRRQRLQIEHFPYRPLTNWDTFSSEAFSGFQRKRSACPGAVSICQSASAFIFSHKLKLLIKRVFHVSHFEQQQQQQRKINQSVIHYPVLHMQLQSRPKIQLDRAVGSLTSSRSGPA